MDNLRHAVPLAPFTTFNIGGPADYFYEARDKDATVDVLTWAHEQHLPLLILGGGSNLLIPDEGFRGLVLHPQFKQCSKHSDGLIVGSGMLLGDVIKQAWSFGLVGLEFAAGIPGTVGGAVVGNAGTYGIDMSSVIASLHYIDVATATSGELSVDDIEFRYRHSSLKEQLLIVTDITLRLQPGDVSASQKIVEERLAIRSANHPHEPSAGCIFKNVLLPDIDLSKLDADPTDLEKFKKFGKIPTGYLIERCGLKGKTIGGAKISEKHANYIVNTGNATATDVLTLISFVKQQIRDTYGVQLQEEVRVIYNS